MKLRRLGSVALVVVFISWLTGCSGGNTPPPPPAVVSITTTTLAGATQGTPYSEQLSASGGTTPYTWSISVGSLPAGLTLDATGGVISGTPTSEGSSTFTVKAADSASSTPGTQSLTIVVAAPVVPLAISSSQPPAGSVGIPYSFTFTATGGTPPYTWSGTALPSGLTLASSTGVLSGTPTEAQTSQPVITVIDSAKNTLSVTTQITISPAENPLPKGGYALLFSGTGPTGPINIDATFVSTGDGSVTLFAYDKNSLQGPPQLGQLGTKGFASIGDNGIGQLAFTLADNSTVTFALAVPAGIGTSGNLSDVRVIEFDDSTGNGTRGAGTLRFNTAGTQAPVLKGNYAFRLSGTDSAMKRTAIIGSFAADGNGNITSGTADLNDNGSVTSATTATGKYDFTSGVNGSLQLTLNNSTYNYVINSVSTTEFQVATSDQVSNTIPLLSGFIQQQTGAFTVASLQGVTAVELSGTAPTSSPVNSDLILGLANPDGAGNVTVTYDENMNGLLAPKTVTGTYTVTQATGRVSFAIGGKPMIGYLINSNEAFLISSDTAVGSGEMHPQSGTPFTNASFKGSYLGGSLPLPIDSVTNQISLVIADGNGNVTVTTESSGPGGLQIAPVMAGTYQVDATGRVVVSLNGKTNAIFDLVSPTAALSLPTAADGSLSSLEQ